MGAGVSARARITTTEGETDSYYGGQQKRLHDVQLSPNHGAGSRLINIWLDNTI